MSDRQYFTVVFEGDIAKFNGNPLKAETPFGIPFAIVRGDAFSKLDDLEANNAELVRALEQAAGRFNMMGGAGLVNGADPRVGYRECMDVLSRVGTPREGS